MTCSSIAISTLSIWLGLSQLAVPEPSGELDAEIGLDYFRAGSTETAGEAIGGSPETLTAQEAGMRLRLFASELERRIFVAVDYHGREPFGGDIKNSTLRLFYRAEVGWIAIPDHLTIAVGRFFAPSVALLPVDGVRAEISYGGVTLAPFAGRRAITTSRRNVDFSNFLPAAGTAIAWAAHPRLSIDGAIATGRDEVVLVKGSVDDSEEVVHPYDSTGGFARLTWRPLDTLIAGGQLAFTQRASYLIGPSWRAVELEVQATDLWNGVAFVDWRPLPEIRLGYDLQRQSTAVFSAGIRTAEGAEPTGTVLEPQFFDNQLSAGWRALDRAWLKGDVRLRSRPDRSERRYGVSLDVDRLWPDGVFARGWLAVEDVVFDEGIMNAPDLDRTLWSIAAGWRADFGLEIEAGASFVERVAGPFSARLAAPGQPESPSDLSPFLLEAERLGFLRAFYGGQLWFAGLDLEQSLKESSELRVLVQAGFLVEESW